MIVTHCELDVDLRVRVDPNYSYKTEIIQVPTIQHTSIPSGFLGVGPIPYTIYGTKNEIKYLSTSNPSVRENKIIVMTNDSGEQIRFEYNKKLYDLIMESIDSDRHKQHTDTDTMQVYEWPEITIYKLFGNVMCVSYKESMYYDTQRFIDLMYLTGYSIFAGVVLYEVWKNWR